MIKKEKEKRKKNRVKLEFEESSFET